MRDNTLLVVFGSGMGQLHSGKLRRERGYHHANKSLGCSCLGAGESKRGRSGAEGTCAKENHSCILLHQPAALPAQLQPAELVLGGIQ